MRTIPDIWQDLEPGQPPNYIDGFFGDDFFMIIDESHMTVPQIGGMYAGDQSRKSTLVDLDFVCLQHWITVLNFDEFEARSIR